MTEVTFIVPAKYADLFRDDVLMYVGGGAEGLYHDARRARRGDSLAEVQMSRATLGERLALMDAIRWEWGGDRELTVSVSRPLLAKILQGGLTDAGDQVARATEADPFARRALADALDQLAFFRDALVDIGLSVVND